MIGIVGRMVQFPFYTAYSFCTCPSRYGLKMGQSLGEVLRFLNFQSYSLVDELTI